MPLGVPCADTIAHDRTRYQSSPVTFNFNLGTVPFNFGPAVRCQYTSTNHKSQITGNHNSLIFYWVNRVSIITILYQRWSIIIDFICSVIHVLYLSTPIWKCNTSNFWIHKQLLVYSYSLLLAFSQFYLLHAPAHQYYHPGTADRVGYNGGLHESIA